ncbi:ABC transporter substrate-binding protein [Paenarthrobacter sp. NPDC057981]|uniref:ABC transporter substrate-binding protein n=1 Tax=Paenarthrobacter sp. NPDC057981 TaxID=3346297 RepID=UPI0036D9DC0F
MFKARHRNTVAVGLTAAFALSLTSCTPAAQPAKNQPEKATFVLSVLPSTLDPALLADHTRAAARFLYDPLINRVDGKTVSGLASKWEITNTSATFTIRDGITCSDGTPMTAKTVARNLEHIKLPATAAPLTSSYIGTTDYTVSTDESSNTVKLSLNRPTSFLEQTIVNGPFMVCDSGLDNPGSLKTGSAGTGPYKVKSAGGGGSLILERRDGYDWGADGAKNADLPPTVEFKAVEDSDSAANLLVTGEADAGLLTGAPLNRVISSAQATEHVATELSVGLMFNERPGFPGADESVRSAVSQALNRDEYASVASDGLGKRADSISQSKTICFTPDLASSVPAGGVKAAESTLGKAGWSRNASGIFEKNGKKLSLRVLLYGTSPAGGELVRSQLATFGIDAVIDSRPEGDAATVLFAGSEWDAAFIGLGRDVPYTSLFTGAAPEAGGLNFSAITSSDYDSMLTQANQKTGQDSCPSYQSAEEIMLKESHWVPLVTQNLSWVSSKFDFNNNSILINPTSISPR